ncbi:MAG: nicotinamide riboside transporter PnuC [Bacteroidota bacterium]
MNIISWVRLLWQQVIETGALQWLSVLLGVIEVILARQNKVWLYPTGIASTIIAVYILFDAGLFAECLLNLYYIIMSLYGWWYWIKKKDYTAVKIRRCNKEEWLIVAGICGGGFLLLFIILKYFTSSTVPLADAWVSSTAWAGMWLLAKRKIENWILLNVSNFFAIPLLFYKQLPLYAFLTIFLFVVAVSGYVKWNRILKTEQQ